MRSQRCVFDWLGSDRDAPSLDQQFLGAIDRNAHHARLLIDPGVAVQLFLPVVAGAASVGVGIDSSLIDLPSIE